MSTTPQTVAAGPTEQEPPPPPAAPTSPGSDWRSWLQKGLAFGALLLLILIFWIATPHFLTVGNVTSLLLATAVIGILAIGTTFVIITGGIDLSIGTGMAMSSVATALVTVHWVSWGFPIIFGVIAGIATGALMGLINGINIAFLKLPPFIVTLAMMMVAQGMALITSGVAPIYFTDHPGFQSIALGTVIPYVPNAVLIMFALAGVAAFLLKCTIFGRMAVAIGSNEEAARLSGINTKWWKLQVYVVGGIFTGIAGVVGAARLNSAQPALGTGYELQAITAVIIGGTSLMGGRGSILGTLIGTLIMAVLINGLLILKVQPEWQTVAIGLVIALAVGLDTLRNRNRST